jgi:outer membrane protein assembly factor BamE
LPYHLIKIALIAALAIMATGCIFRIDIQQGNLLEESAVNQVEIGMTRSQVRFLLGTPMIADSFHQNRWDYTYYFQEGKSKEIEQRWLIVYFAEDQVERIEKDMPISPST